MDTPRELDVVVFGASGFVGRLTAQHLAAHAPAGTRIGLAGRSLERLEEVRDSLGAGSASWPLIVADVDEPATLRALAGRTRVLATTVGPYLKYGLGVVEACASAGTDYVDLTGEVLFVRESLDHWADVARDSGARIVHSCGFDSVPSDLGVLLLAEAAAADGAGTLEETVLVVRSFGGGVSGGTIDSARTMAMAVADDRSLLKIARRPVRPQPRPRRRARHRAAVGHRAHPSQRRARHVGRPVRDGVVQHARRADVERAAGLGVRPHVPLRRGDGLRRRTCWRRSVPRP